jgi:hypothetical protein
MVRPLNGPREIGVVEKVCFRRRDESSQFYWVKSPRVHAKKPEEDLFPVPPGR